MHFTRYVNGLPTLEDDSALPRSDSLLMGNLTCPGRVEILSCDYVRKFDVREPAYSSGASIVPHGAKIKTAEIQVTLWTNAQFVEWFVFKKAILAIPLLTPIGVHHPILSMQDFT